MKTLVRAGRLIDGTGAPARDDVAIVVDRETIAYVGPEADARRSCPDTDQEVDARDGVVIPGLIDGHCHIVWAGGELDQRAPGYRDRLALWGAGAGQVALAAGVTT